VENLATVRAVVAAIATSEDFDLDAVADLRLAVDEACTALIGAALPDAELLLVIDPREDALLITASTNHGGGAAVAPGTFSWHVMSSLVDEVTTQPPRDGAEQAGGAAISLLTRRASHLQ